jgi:DNA-binding HxlR family transcriptional regulator
MKHAAAHEPALCTRFHHASELIGRRWNGAIIFVLLQQTCRFAMLRSAIPGITDRMLSERLQELEEEGLVERTVVPDTPVRVEYALTKKGKSLAEAIGTIAKWAEKYIQLPDAKPKVRRRSAR